MTNFINNNNVLMKYTIKIALLWFFSSIITKCLGNAWCSTYTVLLFSLLIVGNIYNQIIYCLLMITSAITAAIYLPISLIYNEVSYGMAMSVFATTLNESLEFMTSLSKTSLAISLCIFVFAVFLCKIKLQKRNLGTDCASILIFIYCGYMLIEYPYIPDSLINIQSALADTLQISEIVNKHDDWQPKLRGNDYDTFIIVLGESARADFLHAFGFSLPNTPYMDLAHGDLFTNYYSAGPNTAISISHTFALESTNSIPQLNNNIIALANKANFKTYWLSNQGSAGGYDNVAAAIGKKATYSHFIKSGRFNDGNESDGELLPFVKSAISEKSNQKKLIVVHLMGSHPSFCDRTFGTYTQFYMSKDLSCYVQSIMNTDDLLAKITNYANTQKAKWTMMYFSDHGLKMSGAGTTSANLHHADDVQQDYHIPLFITTYDAKKHHLNDNLYSATNFLTMFSQWTGIVDAKIPDSCTPLTNPSCHLESVTAFNNNQTKINVLRLPDEFNHPR